METASVGQLVAVFHINANGAEGGTGRVCSGERSSQRDLNECSVGGGDVIAVHSGVAATGIRGNGRGGHPRGCGDGGSAV